MSFAGRKPSRREKLCVFFLQPSNREGGSGVVFVKFMINNEQGYLRKAAKNSSSTSGPTTKMEGGGGGVKAGPLRTNTFFEALRQEVRGPLTSRDH